MKTLGELLLSKLEGRGYLILDPKTGYSVDGDVAVEVLNEIMDEIEGEKNDR